MSTGDGASAADDEAVTRAAAVADEVAALAAASDQQRAFPSRSFELLREHGLLSAPLRRPLGGQGLGTACGTLHRLYRVLFEVGRGSLPVGRIYEGHVNALILVHLFGSTEQQRQAAHDVHDGRLFGVWNTGAGGEDVRFRSTPHGVHLEGAKVFCSGAGHVDRPFVNGPLDGAGWQMCLVPMEGVDARVEADWWQAEGMRASASGRVDFSGVEVGREWLVGQPDDYHREPYFNGGAVRFAAVQLGGAQAMFDATVAHLRRLDRLGNPHQQERLGRMAIHLESGRLWLLGAARRLEDAAAAVAEQVAYAQMARTAIEAACLDVLRLADRSVGARGLLPPSPNERIGRDLRLYLRQPAADAVLTAAGRWAARGR